MPTKRASAPALQFHSGLCVWSPSTSRVRIEYSPDLLRNLAPAAPEAEAEADSFGTLYGERTPHLLRVLAICPGPQLEPLGIFAARIRGEVFLTERDLERLESLENPHAIALVIAGSTGGFFVREPDGSMQTIQSHQEFPIRPPAPKILRVPKLRIPFSLRVALPLVVAILAAAAILAWPARAFTVHEHDGQVEIVLHRPARPGARLEIVDGAVRRSLPISPALSSVVYTPRTRDVRVSIAR